LESEKLSVSLIIKSKQVMKTTILKAAVIIFMAIDLVSCSKPEPCWVQSTWYYEYVILNNGDTVTYSDGWNMQGMATGATHRKLTEDEQRQLQDHLDTMCRMTVKGYEPFVDQGEKWRKQDRITGKKHTLDYWMRFQNHTISEQYKNLTADDVKMVVSDYYHTYQTFVDDEEKRLYYDIFQ
jgi:hypothetical protein